MKRLPHVWGPWFERLTFSGAASGLVERRCGHCTQTELATIPTLCQWLGATRRWRRRR